MPARALTIGAVTAAISVASLLPAAGAQAAPTATQQVKVISSCTAAKSEPAKYVLACADANRGMTHASYDWWTTKTAHGTATFYYNDCDPYCAAGHFHHMPAEFTLFRVRNTSKYGPLFTRIEVDTRQTHDVYQLPTSPVS